MSHVLAHLNQKLKPRIQQHVIQLQKKKNIQQVQSQNGGKFMDQNSQHKDALQIQIREAYGRIVYTYTTHLKMMNRLLLKNKRVKYAQIILSAISTGGFVGSLITNEFVLTCIGGLFSTALLAMNLYFKDFKIVDEIEQHRTASDGLWMLREKYISLLTDFCVLDEKRIVDIRDDLQVQTYEIYKQSPKTDSKSYGDAQKALKYEEEQFFTDEELDKMLPLHLRKTK